MFVLPCVATVTAARLAGRDVIERIDIRMAVEQAAILLTGLTAALAAFSIVVPGRDWRIALLPLVPLAVWLGSLGEGCMHDWSRLDADGLQVRSDWDCVPAAIILSIPCATIMLVMLRLGMSLISSDDVTAMRRTKPAAGRRSEIETTRLRSYVPAWLNGWLPLSFVFCFEQNAGALWLQCFLGSGVSTN
jgi:hypothetical protein